jgi:hypothetical protein
MSNNLGLFGWIREGVRQSVLQGVSDALDSLGSPNDNTQLHPALLSVQHQNGVNTPALTVEAGDGTVRKTSSSSRKRLGRSLKDIEPVTRPGAASKPAPNPNV